MLESDGTSNFLTVREVADILNLSRGAVYAAIDQGLLVGRRFGPKGGGLRIHRNDLDVYVAASRTDRKRQSSPAKPKRTTAVFKRLNGQRLLQAWLEQGIIPEAQEE